MERKTVSEQTSLEIKCIRQNAFSYLRLWLVTQNNFIYLLFTLDLRRASSVRKIYRRCYETAISVADFGHRIFFSTHSRQQAGIVVFDRIISVINDLPAVPFVLVLREYAAEP